MIKYIMWMTSERDRQASETDKRARQTSERDRQASETDKRARHFFALYIFFSQLIHHNTKNQLKSITTIYISHFFIISINVHVVSGLVAVVIVSHYRSTPRRQSLFICISFYNSTSIALISRRSIAFYRSSISLFESFFLFIFQRLLQLL